MKSALSFSADKGLSNQTGHNNCFLNSAVQVFWHLQVFRRNFLAMKHHGCVQGSCIYCALLEIFREFASKYTDVIDPDMLRVTLAVAFEDQKKFQLGELDDASECYEKILSRVHFHLTDGCSDDFCAHKHCITHQKFSMSLIEQTSCECSATSEPLVFTQLVHYISTSAIIKNKHSNEDFSQLLRRAYEQEITPSSCPQGCPLSTKLTRTLLTQPDVVTIGLVWNSDQSDLSHIKEFVSCIGDELFLHKLFYCPEISPSLYPSSRRVLVGVVCYYMKHYSTFFKRSLDGKWISFDDGNVTEIGHDWSKVVNKVCKGRYQPLLLIFQNPDAKNLETITAPKKNYLIKKKYEEPSKSSRDMKDFTPREANVSNNCTQTANTSSNQNVQNLSITIPRKNLMNPNNARSVDVKSNLGICKPANHFSINNPLFHPVSIQTSIPNNPYNQHINPSNFLANQKTSQQSHGLVNQTPQGPPSFHNYYDNHFNNNFPKLTTKPQDMLQSKGLIEMEDKKRIQQLNVQIESNDLQRKVLERRAKTNSNQPPIINQSTNINAIHQAASQQYGIQDQFRNYTDRSNIPKSTQNYPLQNHHTSTLPHISSSFSSSFYQQFDNHPQHYNTISNHNLYQQQKTQNNPSSQQSKHLSYNNQVDNLTNSFTHYNINGVHNEYNDMGVKVNTNEHIDNTYSNNTYSSNINYKSKPSNKEHRDRSPIIRSANNEPYNQDPSNRISNTGEHNEGRHSDGNHNNDLMNFEDSNAHLKALQEQIGALYKQ